MKVIYNGLAFGMYNESVIDNLNCQLLCKVMILRLSNSGFCFRLKEKSKIDNRKIAIKIEGFYSIIFVESI